jgi:transposase InsO family protein
VLMEVSVVEQRYHAVHDVLREGALVVEVAARLGVSRQTVHAWIKRYCAEGIDGLKDRSHRPRGCPHQMGAEAEGRVLELRRLHPGWGPRRLEHQLVREGIDRPPSRSAIYRCLVRHRLVESRPLRRRRDDYKRWERGRAMELWQMDVMSGVLLDDGTDLKLVSGIDDHSRFCVAAELVSRQNARAVCGVFVKALRRWGVPDEVLTDNGKVFTGHYGANPHQTLFDRICRDNGIKHLLTAVRSPTTTGKVERFHRTLRVEHLQDKTFADAEAAQRELDAWIHAYNTERPHQAINMATPAERFRLGEPTSAEVLPPHTAAVDAPRDGDGWVTRQVASNGVICVAWQQLSVGKHYSGERVDVRVTPRLLEIWLGPELIKSAVRINDKEVRKKHAQGSGPRAARLSSSARERQGSAGYDPSSLR